MNKNQIEELVSSNEKVLLHFTADWCQPCKRMQPNIEAFLQEQPDIKYVKIDVDENGTLAIDMDVKSVPTLMAYTNGEVKKNIGALPLPEIRKLF